MSDRLVLSVFEHAVAVTLFAALAFLATRLVRHAPLVHLIWLLVLLKFLIPSPLHAPLVGAPAFLTVGNPGGAGSDLVTGNGAARSRPPATLGRYVRPESGELDLEGRNAVLRPCVSIVWAMGSCTLALWLIGRTRRFRRILKLAEPAGSDLEREFAIAVRAAGIQSGPVIRLSGSGCGPCLAAVGIKPVMLVPRHLSNALNFAERQTLFAHELAHYRRRDHWLVWLDILVLAAFWWHPVAWLAQRSRRLAAEECCDGYVMRWCPGTAKLYAGTLLKVLDFKADGGASLPAFASGMGKYRHLERRFEMILSGKTRHSLSRPAFIASLPLFAVLLFAPALSAKNESKPPVKQAASGTEVEAECKPLVLTTVAYRVSDLPVWSKAGDFAPEILVWWLQETVDPESWEVLGGPSTIKPNKEKEVLVISTTATNQKAIAKTLEGLRR